MMLMNLSGQQYGCYTVCDLYERRRVKHGTKIYWMCKCECGSISWLESSYLKSKEHLFCSKCKPVGVRNKRLYHTYHAMIQRCYNKRNKKYNIYGGAGITVCDEWLSGYDIFEKWSLENGYTDTMTIDRIDSTIGYMPSNCRWITKSENSGRANIGKHKNKTKMEYVYAIDSNGNKMEISNISAFAREHNLSRVCVSAAIHGRLNRNYHGFEFHSSKIG